ncbi:MAG: cob(I)yrinic acid a,c-diamide adenosyltransferase, partial [Nitrospiria bacterium]
MRITKVYTRTGDKGTTRLAGGEVIPKDHIRLESYGTVDELNAIVGLARSFNKDLPESVSQRENLDKELRRIQDRLFDIGGILATASAGSSKNLPEITAEEVTHLENLMDDRQKDLKPLEEFVLPGGGKVASFLHQA